MAKNRIRKKRTAPRIMNIKTLEEARLYHAGLEYLIRQASKLVDKIHEKREKKNEEFERRHRIPRDEEIERLRRLSHAARLLAEAAREATVQHADGYRQKIGKLRKW